MSTPHDPSDPQPSGFPGPMPPPGGGYGQAPAVQPPREVEASFWFWVATFVIGVLSLLYFFVDFDTVRDTALEEARRQLRANPQVDVAQVENIAGISLIVGAVFSGLLTVLQLVLAFLMRGGRNWARIVLAVLAALGLVSGLYGLSSVSGVQLLLSLLSGVVLLAALVTMFLPGANAWFRARRQY